MIDRAKPWSLLNQPANWPEDLAIAVERRLDFIARPAAVR
jgi:hypothetical protein